jgi:hypothetical protein
LFVHTVILDDSSAADYGQRGEAAGAVETPPDVGSAVLRVLMIAVFASPVAVSVFELF